MSGSFREFPEADGSVHWDVETGRTPTLGTRYVEVHLNGEVIQTWLWSGREDKWHATGKAREAIPQPVLDCVASETR